MYRYLLFDLDGTLVDSSEGIINSAEYALKKLGIPESEYGSLKQFIGPPLKEIFMEAYGMNAAMADNATKIFREFYSVKGKFQCRLYEGITEALAGLKKAGRVLITATSKPTAFSEDILRHLEIEPYFDSIFGSNMDNTRSKKSEIIEAILSEYNIADKSEAVMIGDKAQDLIGAESCGISAVGVSYGFGSTEELAAFKNEQIVHSPQELLEYLEKH